MARHKPGKWSPLRFKSTWREYRHGEAPRPAPERILSGGARQYAEDGILLKLREWQKSPFEHEASCRAGIRQWLCIQGYDWHTADHEADSLVSECLARMGAKRPTWDEGQWQHTHAHEDCYRCGAEIDLEDQARGFRYCSDVCAKASRQSLADQVPWDHDLRRQAYWQIVVANAPVKSCPTCEKKFKSKDRDQEYCSPACLPQRQRELEDRACKWCTETFRPSDNTKVFCSKECATAHRVHTWKQEAPPKTCPSCSGIFRPASPATVFCSTACYRIAKNARRRAAYADEPSMLHSMSHGFAGPPEKSPEMLGTVTQQGCDMAALVEGT